MWIRALNVRVIGLNAEQLGVMPCRDALNKARDLGLDLVEISPTSSPPVCRIMDFGKFKYEQSKKDHAAKEHQRGIHLKEVKLRLQTGAHDTDFKIRHILDFLKAGDKVKITLMFRKREMLYRKEGEGIVASILEQTKELGLPEYPPRMEGSNMVTILIPKPPPKGAKGPKKHATAHTTRVTQKTETVTEKPDGANEIIPERREETNEGKTQDTSGGGQAV